MENNPSAQKIKEDIPYVHIIRVVACIMVVCLHSLPQGDLPRLDSLFRYAVVLLTRPCVPLFLMITGFLLLRNQKSDIQIIPFYKKRIPRVFFPLIIWGVVYSLLPVALHPVNYSEVIYSIVMTPLEYPQEIGGILWYLFTLIGIYLFLPFLSPKLFYDRKTQRVYICLWILSSIVAYFQYFDEHILAGNSYEGSFDVLIYFSGLLGYLILGLNISTIFPSHDRRLLTFLCLIVFIASAGIIYLITSPKASIYPLSFFGIPTIAMSACIYLLIKLLSGGVIFPILRFISKLSFGIYLCHMVIFSLISKRLYEISTSPIIQVSVMILTFGGATVMAWILYRLPYHKYTIGT